MKVLTWLIFGSGLILLASCSPSSPSTHRGSAAAEATATPTATPDTDQDIYWYGNKKYYPLYQVDANEQNVVYLRGFTIHKFLAAAINTTTKKNITTTIYRHQKNFCLAATYKVLTVRHNRSEEHTSELQSQ